MYTLRTMEDTMERWLSCDACVPESDLVWYLCNFMCPLINRFSFYYDVPTFVHSEYVSKNRIARQNQTHLRRLIVTEKHANHK